MDRPRLRRLGGGGVAVLVGLDVVYVGGDGVITASRTLEAPEGPLEYHLLYASTQATGQYVLEVPAGWTARHEVAVGDCVAGLP